MKIIFSSCIYTGFQLILRALKRILLPCSEKNFNPHIESKCNFAILRCGSVMISYVSIISLNPLQPLIYKYTSNVNQRLIYTKLNPQSPRTPFYSYKQQGCHWWKEFQIPPKNCDQWISPSRQHSWIDETMCTICTQGLVSQQEAEGIDCGRCSPIQPLLNKISFTFK